VGTFTVADPHNWIALFAFLVTSLTASQLSARLKRQRWEAIDRQLEVEQLYALSRGLLLINSTQPAGKQIAFQIAQCFDQAAVGLYDRSTGEIFRAGPDKLGQIDSKLHEAALQSAFFKDDNLIVTPVRLGGEPIGSLAFLGPSLSDAALQSLLNLVAVGLEKVRAQEAINRAEVARQSEELKSTLLDAIAHEFKTPLTSIKAVTTELLDSGTRSPQEQELVHIADEAADRLESLVTEAVQLARIEGGKIRLNRAVHFPSSLISGALRQMRSLAEEREIRVEVSEEAPAVLVDADLVQLVLRLLIDNALKYSPPDKPISIRADATEGSMTITVADRGPGIPESEQVRVFEKFSRHLKDHPQIKGTGMGLTIAREILRAHGGDIWVKSIPGQGSEFSFSLPVAPMEKAT
jgi:two-component system sensor histidine kinase KdpD